MRLLPLIIMTAVVLLGSLAWMRAADAADTAAAAADAKLPRYDLAVGRKLVYSFTGESKPVKSGGSEMSTSGTWQATVVAVNPDGSRRVIVRSASSYAMKSNGSEHKQPERVQLGYADSGAGKADFAFTATQDGIINRIYQSTRKTTYHFDRDKGIIARIEGEHTQGYGHESKGTNTGKLESDTMIPADEAKQLAADFDRYFSAREKYTELMAKVDRNPDQADAILAEAKRLIEKARDMAQSEDAKQELAKVLEGHDAYAKYAKESADQFKDVLNKPSPDWSTTDIDGKPAKMSDYKGKVVVMDFWYRGCGWCMYAMPQVKQLAADYQDKPVAVLGMNTDRDEKDARFVIDAFQLQYPTIKADGIPEKYGVQGFPTLIIVDPAGIVRDVHVGYSPDLREKVGKKIDELLNQSAGAGG